MIRSRRAILPVIRRIRAINKTNYRHIYRNGQQELNRVGETVCGKEEESSPFDGLGSEKGSHSQPIAGVVLADGEDDDSYAVVAKDHLRLFDLVGCYLERFLMIFTNGAFSAEHRGKGLEVTVAGAVYICFGKLF
jgi:hypothetical protein